jgi:hypothetical protein
MDMAKVVRLKSTLQDAVSVKTVWESHPDLKLGDIGLSDFIAVLTATKQLDEAYSEMDSELSGALAKRDEKARELWSLIVRFRNFTHGLFGPNSSEYGQTGRMRDNQRRAPVRKSKPASDDKPAATS